MKDSKEKLSGMIMEEELQDLVTGKNDGGDAAAAGTPVILSIIETISIATDIVCPSSACTNAGYC